MNSFLKSFAFAAMLAASAVSAQAAEVTITSSNKYITRKVTSGDFDAIRTNTSIDIIYTVGPRDIEISAPDVLMPYVQVALKGTELIVSYKENMNIKGNHKTCVKISAPNVRMFTTGSAGDITINSPISQKSKTVEMVVLSAGDITAKNIEATEVKLRSNSAGDIKTGTIKADEVSLTANSAGDIETGNITSQNNVQIFANSAGDIEVPEIVAGIGVRVAVNSAGDVEIKEVSADNASFATNSAGDIKVSTVKATNVSANINSAGDLTLSGICTNATLATRSMGDINARNLKAENVTAEVRSGGEVTCWALNSLTATRIGMGEIRYAGKPVNLTIDDRQHSKGVKPL